MNFSEISSEIYEKEHEIKHEIENEKEYEKKVVEICRTSHKWRNRKNERRQVIAESIKNWADDFVPPKIPEHDFVPSKIPEYKVKTKIFHWILKEMQYFTK